MEKPNLDPKRLEGESFENYKKRQKSVSYWMKHRNDENYLHVSKYVKIDPKSGAEIVHVEGTTYYKD